MFKHLITSKWEMFGFMLCSLLFHKFSFKHWEQEPTSCLEVSLLLPAGRGPGQNCHQRVSRPRLARDSRRSPLPPHRGSVPVLRGPAITACCQQPETQCSGPRGEPEEKAGPALPGEAQAMPVTHRDMKANGSVNS